MRLARVGTGARARPSRAQLGLAAKAARSEAKDQESKDLFFQQAGMAGHAQPLAILKNPGIGKASEMLIRLGSVCAFRMISTRHNRRSGIHIHLDVLNIHEAGLELRIREIRQELPSIADFSIPFGIDELVADHASDRSRIADDLGLVPHTLERHQLGGFRR